MNNQAPENYICPICLGVKGIENNDTLIRQTDIVYKDNDIMVFIASYFIKSCEGHMIVVPTEHFENIFDLPDTIGAKIFQMAKWMSAVMKEAYDCGGVTTLQNNGVDAGQHAFHYHLHLFPRYKDDNIYTSMNNKRETTAEERLNFAEKIRNTLTLTKSHKV